MSVICHRLPIIYLSIMCHLFVICVSSIVCLVNMAAFAVYLQPSTTPVYLQTHTLENATSSGFSTNEQAFS